MCLICIEFDRQKMTPLEARRALGEMREAIGPTHSREVEEKIRRAEAQPAAPSKPAKR